MALTEEALPRQTVLGMDGEIPATNGMLNRKPLDDIPAEKRKHILNGHVEYAATSPNGIAHEYRTPPSTDGSNYSIPMDDKLAFTARRLRVITVGAGFSGLLMAHKFQHRFPEMDRIVDHTIFEKRGNFGGTWLVNTYPGVQCDVPSHIYVRFKTIPVLQKQRLRDAANTMVPYAGLPF